MNSCATYSHRPAIRVLAIYRAPQFSPNSVAKDEAILNAVCDCLAAGNGNAPCPDGEPANIIISKVNECALTAEHLCNADVIVSMGRLPQTLALLEEAEERGAVVVNSSGGIRRCARSAVDRLMRANAIPAAPAGLGTAGAWLKRGDEAAQSRDDVVFAADSAALDAALERFRERGVNDIIITEHVPGDCVKFYGVRPFSFFRHYYPTDDGDSKFGDERLNGSAHHYPFSVEALRRDADRLAALTGIAIYGGDCIVRPDGSYAIIDFNDFPSFSRCRTDAATAIARRIASLIAAKGLRAAST